VWAGWVNIERRDGLGRKGELGCGCWLLLG
jgi:hypothetical protein